MNIHEYYHWNYFVREHVNINFNHQTPIWLVVWNIVYFSHIFWNNNPI